MTRGPKPTTLRLATLDPESIQRDTGRILAEHVVRLGGTMHDTFAHSIGGRMVNLTLYAQGKMTRDAVDPEASVERVASALWGCPMTPVSPVLGNDLDDGIAIVLRAALGRAALERNQPISERELACLASVSARKIRRYVTGGALKMSSVRGHILASSAKQFLANENVPGFERAHDSHEKTSMSA